MSAEILIAALKAGNKILVCGNGGSAAQASHFVAELVVRYRLNRQALPAISLNADTAVLTAIGNDFGYEEVFRRQVEALGVPGDVLVALTTSGKSENIKRAIQAAEAIGMAVVTLQLGVPSLAQVEHLITLHEWAEKIEDSFCE